MRVLSKSVLRLMLPGLLALAGLLAPAPVKAQVALIVNGQPVTHFDIEQRIRLEALSNRRITREQAIQELIDDRVKIAEAARFRFSINDRDLDNQIAETAGRMRVTTQQLNEILRSRGVEMRAFRDRLRADMTWQALVRGRFQSATRVRDVDVLQAARNQQGQGGQGARETTTEYTVRQIVLMLPANASEQLVTQRQREAEGLRLRFTNCNEGVTLARALRDVAVLDVVRRSSTDIGQAQRELLNQTAVGRLTPPERGAQGIEMVAVCSREELAADGTQLREVRARLEAQRVNQQAERYLQELRSRAVIDRRE